MTFSVGLTGGICAGKSTVANYFRALDVPVISADDIVSSLLTDDTSIKHKIIKQFGPQVLDNDGQFIKKQLATLIFTNPTHKQWLEALLHPKVRTEILEQINCTIADYVLVEIPLLYRARQQGEYAFLDRILLITCPEAIRLKRLMIRNQLTNQEAKIRLAQQPDETQLKTIANDILDNHISPEILKQSVAKLHQYYQRQV